MNRVRAYQMSVVILLVFNLCTLGFVIYNQNRNLQLPPKNGPMGQFQSLGISDTTLSEIRRLGGEHNQQISRINQLEQKLIYTSLLEDQSTEDQERQIAALELKKIEATRSHFKEVEALLSPEQKKAFAKIKKELIGSLFSNQRPPLPPRPPQKRPL